ncbi:hypothetical protein BU25DRAFT_406548 [Macroventuria anomochaeta]|uniref:Uncharacterized protein n=1 Tax=Macroventuria anomochaeta TaxID=301207 RepID=A0ACB6SCK2_9PLEO|nr:uncharacterized protein BU25DRAFT_406548 [Macroventuria anomochaeta]KAF2632031.1 hypothetical protein BU25DRAFT_406548 [Macroventuria anomochaeta]
MPLLKNKASSSSSSRRLYDDVALSDIESLRQPGMSTNLTGSTQANDFDPSAFRFSPRSKLRQYESAHEEASTSAQYASAPLFIPAFTGLRRTIVEHLTESLQRLEQELQVERSEERVSMAVTLLRQMDHVIESEIRLSRLENPIHADSQGLSVLHFDMQDRAQFQPQPQPWLMVTQKWGEQSDTIVDPIDNVRLKKMLPGHSRNKLKIHADVSDIKELRPWMIRTKTVTEKQKWTLRYEPNGKVRYRSNVWLAWQVIFPIAITTLACFYGVGIIATNTTFSKPFQKYFFWVAIFWSLISSTLLSWLTLAFGASRRDAMGAFLTGIGLWLVVIQIGQTHLLGQFQDQANGA